MTRALRRQAARVAAFTLIEVLAVVLLTSVVIGVVLDHYVGLSRASERATEQTANVRRGAALLDRVARDLEAAVLVKRPEDIDPLFHPWRFTATTERTAEGSDQLKFVTRGRRPRELGGDSDLEVVGYSLQPSEDGESFELLRWSSPRPEDDAGPPEIPTAEEDGAMLLADELADFGVSFFDEFGARSDTWDSTQLERSNTLPAAAEIHVAFVDEVENDDAFEGPPPGLRRTVVLPLDVLDLYDELLVASSLVNGGTGTEEERSEESDMVNPECLRGPCGRMTACQAVNCAAEMGQHGRSTDLAMELAMKTNIGFCTWYVANSALRHLIDNPACMQ